MYLKLHIYCDNSNISVPYAFIRVFKKAAEPDEGAGLIIDVQPMSIPNTRPFMYRAFIRMHESEKCLKFWHC